jgi:hypothetical protein
MLCECKYPKTGNISDYMCIWSLKVIYLEMVIVCIYHGHTIVWDWSQNLYLEKFKGNVVCVQMVYLADGDI